ncbi:bifunctional 4-hydroxy-2-oxoglutarate aldolase/2-dehydro-3-deoxy-phosphogluconate aldolase [Nesterenkonia pannonica]|uniref:bifunctional 4-hydroxy-2-oxoglutarate aldolase/2-dehydro-3-deoxy-phosphogluconate aldolase n=1 Tax=Nesterenkonia pannonica TaxID=1548602 RepID=UPI0021647320|nr:bifunctional 4-hydroxy-2-oxoglutarate aldolase/2-dehydro-3-deoxy-phosphogluconate aldolase [Nesterenkonia pannonica]
MSSSSTLLDSLAAIGVIPVVTVEDSAHAAPMVQALAEGGLPAAEITFRTPAAAEAIAEAAAAHPEALIGAGTVITEKQVDAAAEVSAKYVVSPGTSARVIERAQHHGLAVLPGAVTATEIQAAMEHGIRTVKFFPAEASGGAAALRALAGPFGDVTFVPTGV